MSLDICKHDGRVIAWYKVYETCQLLGYKYDNYLGMNGMNAVCQFIRDNCRPLKRKVAAHRRGGSRKRAATKKRKK